MTEILNELINVEAVYRTAPATPGLLINCLNLCKIFYEAPFQTVWAWQRLKIRDLKGVTELIGK